MKQVITLIFKCVVALLPLWIICIFTAGFPLAYLSTDTVGAYWNKEFTHNNQDKYYDAVILGDSMAATSFMPELLSDSTVNLSLSGSSPVEGYYTLKHYLDSNDAPKDVFICYMDYHLAHDDFTFDGSNQVHKYSIKDYWEIYNTIKETKASNFEELDVGNFWQKALASKLCMPSEYIASITNSIKDGGRYSSNKEVFDLISLCSGRNCRMTNDIGGRDGLKYDNFSVSALQGKYYSRIVQLCNDNNISLHIIKLPLNSNTLFTDEYIAQVNGYYMVLLDGCTNAEFKWYPADYAVEWFWDDYHMNQHGAYRFSMQLKEDYPAIWGDLNTSESQMLALNNDLNIENEAAELFKWIDNKDYTILMYDGTSGDDDLEGIYSSLLKFEDQSITRTEINKAYIVNGINNTKSTISCEQTGESITVKYGENKYDWIPKQTDAISFLIIDNKNHQIVIDKYGDWSDELFKIENLKELT